MTIDDIIKKYRKFFDTKTTIKLWQLFCLAQRGYRNWLYLKSNRIKKLNLGAGENAIEGWLNTDIVPLNMKVVFLDATHKFPFKDNTFDYIFSEHMIEHVPYEKCLDITQECYRILKPGGIIRIATPDLYFLIDLFNKEKNETQKEYIRWTVDTFCKKYGAYSETFVINNFFYNWGHQFIYDYYTLEKILKDVGFEKTTRCSPKRSDHEILQGLEHHETIIPEQFNILETMVIEGHK